MWQTVQATLSARRVEFLLFALLWLTYAYFYQSSQHNEAARFDQTRAIVEDHALSIERFRYNTADVVTIARDGRPPHTYPNKAPGTSLLALLPFWLWMHALKVFAMKEWIYWHVVAYLTTLSTVSLLSAIAAAAMYSVLRRMTGDAVFSALTVVAVWLGTICFPFSTLFFSHQQAAAQLTIAFWALFRLRWDAQTPGRAESDAFGVQASACVSEANRRLKPVLRTNSHQPEHDRPLEQRRHQIAFAALAGWLCGFTVATEYPTVLLVAMLCAYFVATLVRLEEPMNRRLGLGAAFFGTLAVGVLILLIYNLAISGRVFYTPYEAYAQPGAASAFPGHREGYVGVHWPGWAAFWAVLKEITVRPQRGLLYIALSHWRLYACNPVLWLALPGVVWLFRRTAYRLEAILVSLMTAAYLTFNACYGDSIVYWGGAWSVGPRHLIPLLPFLALPLVEGARRLWFLFYPLLLVSVFYMLLATAVEPRVPYEYTNPARELFAANYLRGHLALNREPLFDPQKHLLTPDSTAFNLGKLAGLPGAAQIIPLLFLWLLGGTILLRFVSLQSAIQNPKSKIQNGSRWSALLQPRFSFAGATIAWAIFIFAVSAAPLLYGAYQRHELATGGGLVGRYYPNMNWQGPPAFVRKDPWMDFDWVLNPPLAGRFSVEWTGTIRIARPGRYLFATESDDGSSLMLDGQLIVDNGGTHARRYVAGRVEISRSGVYPLAIRYFNDQYGGMIRATWQAPGLAEELIPPDVLDPPKAETGAK